MNNLNQHAEQKSNNGIDSSAAELVDSAMDAAMQWLSSVSNTTVDTINACTPAISDGLSAAGNALVEGATTAVEVTGQVIGRICAGL